MSLKYLLTFIILSSFSIVAHEATIEVGYAQTVNNYFQIPNQNSNRVDLPNDQNVSARLRGRWDLNEKYFLYFLFAPLQVNYDFQSQNSFNLDGTAFNGNTQTKVGYKFNSYRVGLFKNWNKNSFNFWAGLVLKIRDAEVEVTQGNLSKSYDNIGIVPLLGAGFEWTINKRFSLFSHIDALGASQGYAYDIQAEIRYWIVESKHIVSLGYRSLGGGADNDKVKNFAQFDTSYLSYTYKFK